MQHMHSNWFLFLFLLYSQLTFDFSIMRVLTWTVETLFSLLCNTCTNWPTAIFCVYGSVWLTVQSPLFFYTERESGESNMIFLQKNNKFSPFRAKMRTTICTKALKLMLPDLLLKRELTAILDLLLREIPAYRIKGWSRKMSGFEELYSSISILI